MWIVLALLSALCLGFYDVMKKLSVRGNNVLVVLMLNTLFGALLMSPVIALGVINREAMLGGTAEGHLLIALKAVIVLISWILGYYAIKHLPLTIQGPVNASRPVMVLVGAMIVFGERLNALQWAGVILGFTSLFLISRIGAGEGFSLRGSRWLWMAIGAAVAGAVCGLYDKFLIGRYEPLHVQAWFALYQCVIMCTAIGVIRALQARSGARASAFEWRWTIILISVFLTVADMAYFYALSLPGAMVSVISMMRRGSVIVPFLYGVVVLREQHVRAKALDLALLVVSLMLIVAGSTIR